jgi:hypothetical protein
VSLTRGARLCVGPGRAGDGASGRASQAARR